MPIISGTTTGLTRTGEPLVTISGNAPEGNTIKISGFDIPVNLPVLSYSIVDVIESGTDGSDVTQWDSVYTQSTGATIRHDAQIQGAVVGSIFESLDPSIATVDANGYCSWVSNGTARILVRQPTYSQTLLVQVSKTIGTGSIPYFKNFLPGSLGKHMADMIDTRIAGRAGIAGGIGDVRMWEHDEGSDPNFLVPPKYRSWKSSFNPKGWVYGNGSTIPALDLSGCSTFNSVYNWRNAVTLITRQTGIMASHYRITDGYQIYFWPMGSPDEELEPVIRTIVAGSQIKDLTQTGLTWPDGCPTGDTWLVHFDSPLPASIKHYKYLPANYLDYMPSFTSGNGPAGFNVGVGGYPAFYTNRFEYAGIVDLTHLGTSGASNPDTDFDPKVYTLGFVSGWESKNVQRKKFWLLAKSGDSSSPTFLIINNEPILISVMSSGPGGFQHCLTQMHNAINAQLAVFGDSNTVQTVDLSGFPTYSWTYTPPTTPQDPILFP